MKEFFMLNLDQLVNASRSDRVFSLRVVAVGESKCGGPSAPLHVVATAEEVHRRLI
jgi:hypothetical protein